MGVEITIEETHVPTIPVPHTDSHEGHEWIEKAQEFGWYVPSSWGEMGWDLGHWPLMVVALYDNAQDNVWALVSYVEGDLVLKVFAAWDRDVRAGIMARERRDRAVTDIAVAWWRHGFVPGPNDLPPGEGYLPHHHGPYCA
jgi:hypothetical protein